MNGIIQVNPHLRVRLIKESDKTILCQKIDNSEFVVWTKVSDNNFHNGFYTFDYDQACAEYSKRVWFS